MAGRWEENGRDRPGGAGGLLLALALPGAGTMEAARLLPDGAAAAGPLGCCSGWRCP